MSTFNDQYPQQGKRPREDGVAFIHGLCNAHATMVTPFFRWGFGKEALGWNGLGGFVALLVLAAMCHDGFVFLYTLFWFIALIYQRIQTFKLLRRSVVLHSRYGGYPALAMKMPFVRNEKTALMLVEPLFCVIAGALLCYLSTNLGCLVIFAAASLLIRGGIEAEITRRRVQRFRDTEIEGRWISDNFRNGKW